MLSEKQIANNSKPYASLLEQRTLMFSVAVIHLYKHIAKDEAGKIIGKQVLRSSTSVGAQYKEACKARSKAEFVSKLESASQELSETIYWFNLLIAAALVTEKKMSRLLNEADQLMAMFVSSVKTTKSQIPKP